MSVVGRRASLSGSAIAFCGDGVAMGGGDRCRHDFECTQYWAGPSHGCRGFFTVVAGSCIMDGAGYCEFPGLQPLHVNTNADWPPCTVAEWDFQGASWYVERRIACRMTPSESIHVS